MDPHETLIWPQFDDWWDAYDYKLDRKRCQRLWSKMKQKDKEAAMAHTEAYVASTYTDGRYPSRRHPGTYLNNENWHDEALIPKPPQYVSGVAESLADRLAARKARG